MARRRILWTVALALAIASTVGAGLAAAGTSPAPVERPAAWERMHAAPWMREVHARMGRELQERCEAMHARMSGVGPAMGGAGMMGPAMGSAGMSR